MHNHAYVVGVLPQLAIRWVSQQYILDLIFLVTASITVNIVNGSIHIKIFFWHLVFLHQSTQVIEGKRLHIVKDRVNVDEQTTLVWGIRGILFFESGFIAVHNIKEETLCVRQSYGLDVFGRRC